MGIGKWLFNNSGSVKNYGHGDIPDNSFWEIPSTAIKDRLGSLDDLFSDISSGDVCLSLDGETALTVGAAEQWNVLRSPTLDFVKKTKTEGIPKFSIYEPEGDFQTFVSHDLTRKDTWYLGSNRVTGEVLTKDVLDLSGKTYLFSNSEIINLYSGNVTKEDDLLDDYCVMIYIDGALQSSGYTLDLGEQKVVFDSSPGSSTVSADYSYAGSSTFTISPDAGKRLILRHVEIQFTKDVLMKETWMDIWAYNPADLPNKMLIERVKYKNLKDMLNMSNLVYTASAFHNLRDDLIVFPFDYARAIILSSAYGAEIRITIKDDEEYYSDPIEGKYSFATISFYCAQEDE